MGPDLCYCYECGERWTPEWMEPKKAVRKHHEILHGTIRQTPCKPRYYVERPDGGFVSLTFFSRHRALSWIVRTARDEGEDWRDYQIWATKAHRV